MFSEPGPPHHAARFHAYYQDEVAIISIQPVELTAGAFPLRQRRLVEAWAELHQDELMANRSRLHAGRSASPIEPLK
jgi:hypothetical protein